MIYLEILSTITIIIGLGLLIRRLHIKNKCDLILTNANVIALDRQYVNNENVDVLIDTFISKSFDDILALNIEYAKLQNASREHQNELQKILGNRVAQRISPSLVNKVSIIYNKKYMDKILGEKCYIYVLTWAMELNSQKYKKIEEEYSMFNENIEEND